MHQLCINTDLFSFKGCTKKSEPVTVRQCHCVLATFLASLLQITVPAGEDACQGKKKKSSVHALLARPGFSELSFVKHPH